jgi:hypothetical protein
MVLTCIEWNGVCMRVFMKLFLTCFRCMKLLSLLSHEYAVVNKNLII